MGNMSGVTEKRVRRRSLKTGASGNRIGGNRNRAVSWFPYI